MKKIVNGKLPKTILRSSWRLFFCYSFFGRTKEVKLCFSNGLPIETIQIIAQIQNGKPVFTSKEMSALRYFAMHGITFEQFQIIAKQHDGKPVFDYLQMSEIFYAIQDGLGNSFIETITESQDGIPTYTAKEMWAKRSNALDVLEVL